MALALVPLDVTDTRQLDDIIELYTAGSAVDAPYRHPISRVSLVQDALVGWDGDPEHIFLHYSDDGRLRAFGGYAAPSRENLDTAWLFCQVHPEDRRQGIGTALVHALEAMVGELGRTKLGSWGPDTPHGRAFAASLGYQPKSVSVLRRVHFGELPAGFADAAYAEAAPHAADYELLRIAGPLPDDLMPTYLAAVAAINDAPLDDLDYDDEVFDAARVRAYEQGQLDRRQRLYRVLARHRSTGEIAGHTVATIDIERPHLGDQHDTTVLSTHRGHRLGLLLKADMMRWLAEAEPQCTELTTGNAESNTHMIAVNERLGYRIMGKGVAYQRPSGAQG